MTGMTLQSELRLEAAEDMALLIQRKLRPLGIEHFAYYVEAKNVRNAPFIISNYPDSWVSQYSDNGYYERDPVIIAGRRRVSPFSWSEFGVAKDYPAGDSIFNESRSYGIQSGYSFPLHDPCGRYAVLSICNLKSDPDFDRIVVSSLGTAHLIFVKFHDSFASTISTIISDGRSNPEYSGPVTKLTPRESEVILWASEGKTYEEISIILALSVRTVKFHMANIVLKLGASNAKHAICKAKRSNLV